MLACVRVCKCELRKCRAWRRIHMLNMLFECHVAVRLARLESDLPYEDIFCALVATIHFDVYTDISTTQAIWCIWSIRNTLTMSFTICFRFFVSRRNSFAPFCDRKKQKQCCCFWFDQRLRFSFILLFSIFVCSSCTDERQQVRKSELFSLKKLKTKFD